jgi:hypothetical protein
MTEDPYGVDACEREHPPKPDDLDVDPRFWLVYVHEYLCNAFDRRHEFQLRQE